MDYMSLFKGADTQYKIISLSASSTIATLQICTNSFRRLNKFIRRTNFKVLKYNTNNK